MPTFSVIQDRDLLSLSHFLALYEVTPSACRIPFLTASFLVLLTVFAQSVITKITVAWVAYKQQTFIAASRFSGEGPLLGS